MTKSTQGQRVVTPRGRLSFPSLLKPDVGGQYSDGKYKATLVFDKKDPVVMEGLKALMAEAKKVASQAFGAEKVDMPFRDGNEKVEKGDWYKDTVLITAKSKYRPGVCAADPKVEITEESDIYGGCYVRASLVPFSYAQGKNKGVSFRLCNVQKLADGEPFGGTRIAPADEFETAAVDVAEDKPFEDDDLGF